MKKWIVGALIALVLGGLYQSRLVHGIWFARNLYRYGYEPRQVGEKLRQQQAEIQRLKKELAAKEAARANGG